MTALTPQALGKWFRLDGKTALVAGGYGGIGAAVCWGLAAAGARVAVAGRSAEKCAALAQALAGAGYDALAAPFDAQRTDDIGRMVDETAAHFGGLDVLVNCVGLNREEKLLEVTEANFDYVYTANLKSALFLSQAAARHMLARGAADAAGSAGKLVHLGSVRTLLGLRGRGYAAYTAAKGGLGTLCKQLAAELAPHRINVNVVAPTFVRTAQVAAMLADEQFYAALTARIPLGRVAEPEEVMHAVLFFASPAADFITGQILYLDGGITATQ